MSNENRMECFCYSGVTSERCVFTWRIEKFSLRARQGVTIKSPISLSKPSGSGWLLTVTVREEFRRGKYENSVNVYLDNTKCSGAQFVVAKISIVGVLGISWKTVKREVQFSFQEHTKLLCSIPKKDLVERYFGLNKLLFLPSDSLTLFCEMTAYAESSATIYNSRQDFENSFETPYNNARRLGIRACNKLDSFVERQRIGSRIKVLCKQAFFHAALFGCILCLEYLQ